jgi:hypothetical protein
MATAAVTDVGLGSAVSPNADSSRGTIGNAFA